MNLFSILFLTSIHGPIPFGEPIGRANLTEAYSNHECRRVSNRQHAIILDGRQLFTGLKWECVEYARRWLIDNQGITFSEVRFAYEIWNLKVGERVDTGRPLPLLRFENKTAKNKPEIGDLLIYNTEYCITGHVAVIVGVDDNSVTIAEQNYFDRPWDGPNFSRRLLLHEDRKGCYRIFDEAVIGWVRFDVSN